MSTVLTDEELMDRYRRGQPAAFALLYERHKGTVYRYLRRVSRDPAVAEELSQDVWVRLIDARASYQERAKLTTWLFTIAQNCLMNHLRGRQSHNTHHTSYECIQEFVDSMPTCDPGPSERALLKERAAQLLAAIAALPLAQREAFLLQQEGGLTVQEIVHVTGVNRETAKSRLRYALARLRTMLHPSLHHAPDTTALRNYE